MATSVVVPAYDSAAHIVETLDALAAQTVAVDEVVVVDDGSADETAAVVERWQASHALAVTLIRQANAGTGAARNAGIEAASGEWVAFCDADDLWEPGKHEAYLAAGADADWVCGATALLRPDGEVRGGRSVSAAFAVDPLGHLGRIDSQVATSTAMVRREALLAVGGFDEDPGLTSVEDYDLWCRGAAAGWRLAVVNEPLVRYRLHAGQVSRSPTRQLGRAFAVHRRHFGDGLRPRLRRSWHALRSCAFARRLRPPGAVVALVGLAVRTLVLPPKRLGILCSRFRTADRA